MKHQHVRSAQYDQILKKNEQIYALLALALALCPAASKVLDETVNNTLREKYASLPRPALLYTLCHKPCSICLVLNVSRVTGRRLKLRQGSLVVLSRELSAM